MDWRILPTEHDFLEAYEDHKDLLLDYIRTGAVARADIDALIEQNATDFGWDMVFVDEGQDWPPNEIEILRAVYTPERIAVADGVDQFVRSSVADWSRGVARERFHARRLTRCLRMKANLAYFVTDFVTALGLQDWDLEPNPDATGGRVLDCRGRLGSPNSTLRTSVCSEAAQLGNYPVDLLACVPPSLVQKQDHETFSVPGHTLAASGRKVWDASSIDVREHFPTDRDALRIVQYDSCRGLEGWTVINYGFDEFWEYKYRQWLTSPYEPDNLFETTEERAALFASSWAMIPLTRAIDTLVINISAQPSLIKQALTQVQEQWADFIEWIKL